MMLYLRKQTAKLPYVHTLPEVSHVSLFSLNQLGHYEPASEGDSSAVTVRTPNYSVTCLYGL